MKYPLTDWEEWFAWYPVKVDRNVKLPRGAFLPCHHYTWLKTLWRRRVLHTIPTGEQCLAWEYQDKHIFDILRDS